jgi:uncharacterized protein (TIGR03083 family)
MRPIEPLYTVELFPVLHTHLLELLSQLTNDDWHRPTVCKGWSVKDIASHLADGNFRRITTYRDNYSPAPTVSIDSYPSLVNYLNQLNQDWVVATRRLSPQTLIDWLEQTGPQVYQLFKELPPFDTAVYSVAWAGEQTSPNWFHIAREYTELWHHQQQIRLAVNQPDPLMTVELYYPLLDTFMRALPHTYRDVEAPANTLIKVVITGLGGGDWHLYRHADRWKLVIDADECPANTVITINGSVAWRLFSNGLTPQEALPYITITGDQRLGSPVLTMLSVMA